jgi:hypothetical protein
VPIIDASTHRQVNVVLPLSLVQDLRRYSTQTDLKINAICKQALQAYLRERGALSLDRDGKKGVR